MKQEIKELLKSYEVMQWLYENKDRFKTLSGDFFCCFIKSDQYKNNLSEAKEELYLNQINEIVNLNLFKSIPGLLINPKLSHLNYNANTKCRYNLLNVIFKS